jgi:hypothetical protein
MKKKKKKNLMVMLETIAGFVTYSRSAGDNE